MKGERGFSVMCLSDVPQLMCETDKDSKALLLTRPTAPARLQYLCRIAVSVSLAQYRCLAVR